MLQPLPDGDSRYAARNRELFGSAKIRAGAVTRGDTRWTGSGRLRPARGASGETETRLIAGATLGRLLGRELHPYEHHHPPASVGASPHSSPGAGQLPRT